ncbi:hypothetical protein L226DRAFT_383437 [Lentinus tigrinus ALCF2SS1-7]|uniref:uncharacterized protein n=1 Tax=Lentinus tigrinus ALCF2SS1-7 TaxID=1328758 RepID=UPI001165FA70|nr:hypothetical protein L226DRAFT_383437 [Lentinus tigrinus ALCF2SS1-7]
MRLITELAGLLDESAAAATTALTGGRDNIGANAPPVQEPQAVSEAAPPLPIAAAHHPAHLHALRLTLFPKSNPSQAAGDEQPDGALASTPVPHAVTERLAVIHKVSASLQTALANAQSIHAQLQHRLEKARSKAASQQPLHKAKSSVSGQLKLDATLWSPRHGKGVDFKPADESALARFGLADHSSDNVIEDRIAHIRTALLPPFTADPLPASSDSDSEPEAPAPQTASRLRPPSSRTQLTNSRGVPSVKGSVPPVKPRAASATKQVRVADAPKATRVPSASGLGRGGASKTAAAARRLSRRASAARTRRSTMFGRGSDAAILRIVEAVQDRSDSEAEEEASDGDPAHTHGPRTPLPRTPARSQMQGTRGTLLSSMKKSGGPRQSFDIEKYERVKMPRLPSLRLQSAPELDEEENERRFNAGHTDDVREDAAPVDDDAEDEEVYEGNSMTLADILLQAGHQRNASMQLLEFEEDELGDMSDWE